MLSVPYRLSPPHLPPPPPRHCPLSGAKRSPSLLCHVTSPPHVFHCHPPPHQLPYVDRGHLQSMTKYRLLILQILTSRSLLCCSSFVLSMRLPFNVPSIEAFRWLLPFSLPFGTLNFFFTFRLPCTPSFLECRILLILCPLVPHSRPWRGPTRRPHWPPLPPTARLLHRSISRLVT